MTSTATRFLPAIPLVEAKLNPPVPRHATVERTQLLDAIGAGVERPVVSVVASAGYGKTTLLAQWAAAERRPVAWLSLDDLDNDPVVLLSYLAAALDRIEPIAGSLRSALTAPPDRILAAAVPRLTSRLYEWQHPAVLIFDDVHHLVDQTCLDILTALMDQLAPGFQIAIAGRTDPRLPLARHRAQGGLLEIDQRDLALDLDEITALAKAAGFVVSRQEAGRLLAQTEGWAVGIYLAAVARDRRPGALTPLTSVSGRDEFIADYLRSEFERDFDGDQLTFLTRTSILDTVSPDVAETVAAMPAAGTRLHELALTNLLIQEVKGSTDGFRYHNLLRDFLLAELERREPGGASAAHRRASSWFLAAGELDQAVDHAMAGGDTEGAARIVAATTLPMFYAGKGRTLDRWLRGFDPDGLTRYPSLAVAAGWLHLMNGRVDAANQMGDIIERSAAAGASGLGAASFESERAMLQAVMARRGPSDALAKAEYAVSQEAPDSAWRPNALWLLGSARLLLGDSDAADAAFDATVAARASAGATEMVALAGRASIAMARGDWQAADGFARSARAGLETSYLGEILPSLIVYAVGARIAIKQGDIAGGRADLVRAQLVRPMATYVAPWFAVSALLELARAYLAISDPTGARLVVREAEQVIRKRPHLGTLTTDLIKMRQQLAGASATLVGASALTNAELRLLPLLPTYLSFVEIGDRLGISRHTVKTQAMSIYGKVEATSRGEAVERAIELGLLEPFYGLRLAQPVSNG